MGQDMWIEFRTAWGASAAGYDELFGHGLRSDAERTAWLLLVRRLLPELGRQLRVLDVGTGTGAIALMVGELGHEVVGADYAEEMLKAATEKAAGRGLSVSFVLTDAMLDGIENGHFDVVICRHVLWALPYPEEALRRWRQVCRPGGKVVVIDQLRPRVSMFRQGIRDLADVLHPLLGTGDSHDGRFPKIPLYMQPLKRASSPEPAVNAMRRAGLSGVQSERLAWIDEVERAAMPALERWAKRWNRYVVEGWA